MSDTFRIESVDGVMPTEINGFEGYRIFATLDDAVSQVGEGRTIHVFAKKENRWKPGDEVEILEVNESFNLNGPGEEDLPEGEGSYVYAKIQKPKQQGRFQRQSKGFQAPAQQAKPQGFRKPAPAQAAPAQAKATPTAAPAPVKKVSLEEADVVYDRLLGESLRACAHTTEDFYGKEPDVVLRACIVAQTASERATAMFNAWTNGRLDVTPKRNPIKELVAGVDVDNEPDTDDMD